MQFAIFIGTFIGIVGFKAHGFILSFSQIIPHILEISCSFETNKTKTELIQGSCGPAFNNKKTNAEARGRQQHKRPPLATCHIIQVKSVISNKSFNEAKVQYKSQMVREVPSTQLNRPFLPRTSDLDLKVLRPE